MMEAIAGYLSPSRLTRGAASRLPVWKTRFGSWLLLRASTERMSVKRSNMAACFGRCSQIATPGQFRGDRRKGTAVFIGPIRFDVPRIDVARATGHPQQNHALAVFRVRRTDPRGGGSRAGSQQIGQGEARHSRESRFEHATAAGKHEALPLAGVHQVECVTVVMLRRMGVIFAHSGGLRSGGHRSGDLGRAIAGRFKPNAA